MKLRDFYAGERERDAKGRSSTINILSTRCNTVFFLDLTILRILDQYVLRLRRAKLI